MTTANQTKLRPLASIPKHALFKIYNEGLAAICAVDAGKAYQPCNGSEGIEFTGTWCGKCARDKSMSEGAPLEECDDDERCDLIANSMAYDIEEEGYPKEWIYAQDGQPCCTAFVEVGQPIPPSADDLTLNLFPEEGAV